jgi:Arc/MetJ-type ribon-helix-helix transcriptional regulator
MPDESAIVSRVAKRADLDEQTAAKAVQALIDLIHDALADNPDQLAFVGFGRPTVPITRDWDMVVRRSDSPRHNVTVRLSDAELAGVDMLVEAKALHSRSDAIRAAIDSALARLQRAALAAAVAQAYGPVADQPPAWGLEAWQAVVDAER